MSASLPGRLRDGPWLRASLAFGLLTALLIAATFDTLQSMVTVWHATTTYHHCFLVLPISLALIWRRRARLRRYLPHHSPAALLGLLGFGALWLIGLAGDLRLFQHVALIGLLVSLFVAVFGSAIAREIRFPLAFLAFMVPAGNVLIPHLQSFTAEFAVRLLRLAAVPVFQDGIMIETPAGVFEVAEACAGVRFLIANVMVGALFAHLALSGWRKRAAFLAVAAALPIIANGLRAFGIMYLAQLTGHAQAASVDHLLYGWIFFALVMVACLALGSRFADWPVLVQDPGPRLMPIRAPWRVVHMLPVVLLLVAPQIYARTIMASGAKPFASDPGSMLALDLDCLKGPPSTADWSPRFAGADVTLAESLACRGQTVDLFVALYARETQGVELVNHANRLDDGVTWKRVASGWYDPKIAGLPAKVRLEQQRGPNGLRVVLAWYWVGGHVTAQAWQAKLWQIGRTLTGRTAPAALIALSAPVEDAPNATLATLRPLLRQHREIERFLSALAAS